MVCYVGKLCVVTAASQLKV